MLTLVENAEKAMDENELPRNLRKRIKKNELNFEDFVDQLKQNKKNGFHWTNCFPCCLRPEKQAA
ncbi:MAG: hypothetical protein U5N58_10465 [Actinomycetota bacterium]|nr:hypothetical protein [Actinomycetota bacterium]